MANIEVLFNTGRKIYENKEGLPENFGNVEKFYSEMEEYKPTSLVRLSDLAKKAGIKDICVKNESERFGLNAFKGLGVSYALNCLMAKEKKDSYLFVSCTDGNHGRALAWRSKSLGHKCVIFMPSGSEEERVKAIEEFGAKVIVTDKNYMGAVMEAAKYAEENGGYLVQDTYFEGYDSDVPDNIVLGYSTMVKEALAQMEEKPTHVFVQAGVGSAAAGVIWYIRKMISEDIITGVIEADCVACIYESIEQGKDVAIDGIPYTVMAGLNCGEANLKIMPLLKDSADCFIKCSDEITYKGMERALNPVGEDECFNSGPSGAVGLGFVEEVLTNEEFEEYRKMLGFDENSVVLVFNTEGRIDTL